jgi:hypothetical protein
MNFSDIWVMRITGTATIWAGFALALLGCSGSLCAAQWDVPLKSQLWFRADGTFKILAFGDVHWDKASDKDKATLRAMETIVEAERPDLVIYTGDNCLSDRLDDVERGYRQLTEPVVRRKIPWAATLGNHDAERGGISRRDVFSSMLGQPGNLSRLGPSDIHGYGNFILPIMDPVGKKRAALVYVLDSNAYYKRGGLETYDWIHQDQIQWYRYCSETYRKKNRGQYLPSYAFCHIPLPEFAWVHTNRTTVGVKQEDVCGSAINGGLAATILDHRDIKALFCGHDHVNDFISSFDGLWLGYVRGISYNTYGKDNYAKGSRVILLKQGTSSFDTWLRLEDGQVVNRVHCD